MKLIVKALLCTILLLSFTNLAVIAAPTEQEIIVLLNELNWTMEELEEYLAFYEFTLDDFETVKELKWMLGTPITEENLNELLQKYDMTYDEFEAILIEFGDSLNDYRFIEDLEAALDFYLNHEDIMIEIEQFLSSIGLSNEEIERLFNHLMSLDETVLETEMENIMSRLEPYMNIEDPSQLTDSQQQELFDLWEEMLAAFHLRANFYLVDGTKTPISFADLTRLEALNGRSVLIELYDLEGNLLLDMQLSNDMLTSDFLFDAAEEFIHIGDLAGELTSELHKAKLPDTASPYGFNILVGLFLLLIGMAFYTYSRRYENA